jgi:hypothetical protein
MGAWAQASRIHILSPMQRLQHRLRVGFRDAEEGAGGAFGAPEALFPVLPIADCPRKVWLILIRGLKPTDPFGRHSVTKIRRQLWGQSGNENVGVEDGSYLDLEKHPATVIPAEVEDYVQSGSGWILGRLLTMHSSCFTNTRNASPLTRHAVRIQIVIL